MEFQFGTNWAYYSHYVGDIFGAPLAIEGLMAFFLESTFIGLFFFGWDRLSKTQHLMVTALMAVGTNLSALWILIANGWMQNPVGAEFNYRHDAHGNGRFLGRAIRSRRAGQIRAYRVGRLRHRRDVRAGHFEPGTCSRGATSSLPSAAFASPRLSAWPRCCRVIVLGDESGYTVGEAQQTKMAALEAMWETEPAPAGLKLAAGINEAASEERLGDRDSVCHGPDRHTLRQQADSRHHADQGTQSGRIIYGIGRSRRCGHCATTARTTRRW